MIDFYKDNEIVAVTCSMIGKNHIDKGLDNQDSILFKKVSDNRWMLVLADGVSSARNAKAGSEKAVRTIEEIYDQIVSCEKNGLDLDSLKIAIVKTWKSMIESDWDEYASTLNFAFAVDNEIVIGQIGDGLIVANIDGETEIFTENEDFYTTETNALGSAVKKSAFTISTKTIDKFADIYMASDGIGKEVADDSRIDMGQYLSQMLKGEDSQIQKELETWIDGLGRKNGDDKSIGFVRWER